MNISKNIACLLILIMAACTRMDELGGIANQEKWDILMDDFIEQYFHFDPPAAVRAGRHEFDGRLPDFSTEGQAREILMLKKVRVDIQLFDTTGLGSERKFEKKYLLNIIQDKIFWLETAQWPLKNFRYYRTKLSPEIYISKNYAPLDYRLGAMIAYLDNLPEALSKIRENMSTYPMPKVQINLGKSFFGGLAKYFQSEVPVVFQKVEDQELLSKYHVSNQKAVDALRSFVDWIESRPLNDNFSMETEMYEKMLRCSQGLDISVGQLNKIGLTEKKRNLNTLKQACENYAPGLSITECLQKINDDKPEKGAIEFARTQLEMIKSFVLEKNIVSIPGNNICLIKEAPPYRRTNGAYISIPGPYESDTVPAIFYLAPVDSTWTPEEIRKYTRSKTSILNTAVHEVWPGHFLQRMHSNFKSQSKLGQLFKNPVFSEGWAHYCEEMMIEAGFGTGHKAYQIRMIQSALMRNVRFLVSIGLHTENMSLDQAEAMFIKEAFLDPASARQQAARGAYDPGYFNYTLGKILIRNMKQKCLENGMSIKEFHNKLLSFGMPPIPVIYEEMTGEKQDLFVPITNTDK